MTRFARCLGGLLFTALFVTAPLGSSDAQSLEPVTLEPLADTSTILTLTDSAGQTRNFSLPDIERLGTYRLYTETFWPGEGGNYEGVLLKDLLATVNIEGVDAILVEAIDGYAQSLPRRDWERWPTLVATRKEGQPMTVRNKGPLRIIFPMESDPELQNRDMGAHWVWMIRFIAPE